MKWNEQVELYLRLQFENNQRLKHAGLNILRDNCEITYLHLQDYILMTHATISSMAERISKTQASTPLTNVSSTIGRDILMSIGPTYNQADWKRYLQVGDLIIEAFFNSGLLDVVTPPMRSREPVKIVIDDRWPTDLPEEPLKRSLRGTFAIKPKDIQGPTQLISYAEQGLHFHKKIVKRWDEKLDGNFKKYLNTPAIRAVNKLQQTSWTINSRVLDAVLSDPSRFYKEADNTEENLSKRIDYEYTTAKATILSGEEFYTAADMDYRGRIYFVESFLNFQGSDLARGLLMFSNKKKIDANGLKWLKIHTASSFNQSYPIDDLPTWCEENYADHLRAEGLDNISVDKMTLRDRANWCDNNRMLIVETAERGTIHDCEKPVNFLAAAMELTNRWANPDYESGLPIPVDGSNNGWQHLGAISKDTQTGKLVGLVPVGIQNDFYVQTAKRLIEITKDPERLDILQSMPMKAIRKGISKRGSMTRAYSAGAQKIAENMYQDCKSAGYTTKYGITETHCKGFARDLVKAIADVCPGPLHTMKFLQNIAQAKLEEGYNYLRWITPSGFPVVYENYHRDDVKFANRIKGIKNAQGKVKHVIRLASPSPDRRGFMCGISPNFVHSQDAAHMQMVIDQFSEDFGAVHDSFSTHASDVEELLTITKNVFISMYDHENYFEDIIDRLGATAEQPEIGQLEVSKITESDYFFA